MFFVLLFSLISLLLKPAKAQCTLVIKKRYNTKRIDPTTGDVKFPKLTDIQQIYLHQDQGQISIEFKLPSTHRYVMESCTKLFNVLQQIAQDNYGIQLPVIESPAPKFAVMSDPNASDADE